MAMLTIKDFPAAKERLPPVGLDLMIIRVLRKKNSSENEPYPGVMLYHKALADRRGRWEGAPPWSGFFSFSCIFWQKSCPNIRFLPHAFKMKVRGWCSPPPPGIS